MCVSEHANWKRMRIFFLYFNLFGMWSVRENSTQKLFFQATSFLSSISVLPTFVYAAFFNQFFDRNSLLGNNFLFIFIFASRLTIIIETFSSTETQMEIIEKLSLYDQFISIKFGIRIPYQMQKLKSLALSIVLMLPVFLTNIVIICYIHFREAVFLNAKLSIYSI